MHRRLVNEAGDVSEDVEMALRCYPGKHKERVLGALRASVPFLLLTLSTLMGRFESLAP